MEKSNGQKVSYAALAWMPIYGLVGLGFALLYLLTLSPNLSVAHDSISYLSALSDTAIAGNGHHLLQHVFTSAWIRIGLWLGFEDFLLIANSLNALAGGIMLGLVFRIAHERLGLSLAHSLAAVLIIGFSYGIWAYSIVLEVYMLPICLMMASIWCLMGRKQNAWVAALILHIFATLFHQMHLLWVPVAMLYLYYNKGPYWRYAIFWGLGVGLTYIAFMWAVMDYRTVAEMQGFILGLTQESYFWGLGGALGILVGNARAWIGGHFMFGFATEAGGFLGNFATADDQYLVKELSPFWRWLCLGFGLLAGGLLVRFYALTGLRLWRTPVGERSAPWLLAGGILIYSAFFVIWVPVNPEFWLLQLVLWSLLFAWQSQQKGAWLWALVICLSLTNWWGSIRWLQSQDHDLYYQKAIFWQANVGVDDLILVEQGWPQLDFASHFTESRLLVLETAGLDSLIKVASQHDRILLEAGLVSLLELDSLAWQIKSLPGPVGPYELWERK
ncbi:MAG: hypothetical protein AAFN10_10020 [Bacteroidota bacterium]